MWERLSLPMPAATAMVGLIGVVGPLLCLLWMTVANDHLPGSAYMRVPAAGRATTFLLFRPYRTPIIVVAATALALGISAALVTEGFRFAGPRLQWATFVLGVIGTVVAMPPAAALVVAVVALAVFLAFLALILALVLGFIALLLSAA